MLVIIRILLAVYTVAINVYSFLLLKFQKDSFEDGDCESTVRDGKLFTAAVLGGALGIYVAMFVLKFRLKSLFLMVFMPVMIALNAYILIMGFVGDFGLYRSI